MSKGFIIIADIMPVSHLLPQDPKEVNKPIGEQPFRKFAIFNGKLSSSPSQLTDRTARILRGDHSRSPMQAGYIECSPTETKFEPHFGVW